MNNWKIGTRIGAGFGVVILIAMALGLFAINRVGAIQQNADAVALGAFPKVHLDRGNRESISTPAGR